MVPLPGNRKEMVETRSKSDDIAATLDKITAKLDAIGSFKEDIAFLKRLAASRENIVVKKKTSTEMVPLQGNEEGRSTAAVDRSSGQTDPIATQLAAIAAKLEVLDTLKEDIAALVQMLGYKQAEEEEEKDEENVVKENLWVVLEEESTEPSHAGFIREGMLTAATSGLPLSDVAAEARHACGIVGTIGVALSVYTLPGQPKSDRLGPGLSISVMKVEQANLKGNSVCSKVVTYPTPP